MLDATSPRRISSPSAFPAPSRCSWPRNSSSVRGRMRAASGSAECWNRVGSDTGEKGMGKGERDAWFAVFGTGPQDKDPTCQKTRAHIVAVKQLASLEAWKCSNELARSAYRLTL